ncbi:MAG: hypothetical protein ABSD73_12225 [Candidatus Bathyarchaeia archaeon]|jgi:ribosomal protein L37AE/L43A
MVRKSNICPKCHSTKIEPSWGSEGYMQCNVCGHEWRQGKNKKLNWKKIGKLPKPKKGKK